MNLCPILGWRENRKTSILRPKNPLLSLFFPLKPTQWTLPRPSKRAVSANAVLGIIWSLTTSWTRTGDWWQTFWGDFWMDFRVDFQDNFGVFYRKRRVFFWHQRNSGGFLPTISMAIVHSYVSLPGKNPFFSPPFAAILGQAEGWPGWVGLRRMSHWGATLFSIEIREPWNWENLGNLWGILSKYL